MSTTPVLGDVLTGLVVSMLLWWATAPWWVDRALVGGGARRSGRATRRATRSAGGPRGAGGVDGPRSAVPGGGDETEPVWPSEPSVDVTVVLDLLAAALASGAGLPRSLDAVGRSVGGVDGTSLSRAAAALLLGAGWAQAWERVPGRLGPVAEALRPAWVHGAPPGDALRVAREQLVHEGRARARTAAARLGVRLVLPLGLCLLPAFVLLGLVPVMVALGSGLGLGLLGG